MALALRPPGTEKSQVVHPNLTRERLSHELLTSDSEQKAVAISELAARGENFTVSHLDGIVQELRRTGSPGVKQAVCKALISAKSAAVPFFEDVVGLVNDIDPEVRYWGCLALGSMGPSASGAKSQVVQLLGDSSEAVRFGACSALGGFKADDCVDSLKAMLSDTSPEVQGAACLALGKLGVAGTPYAELVAQRLQEPGACKNALKALALMGLEGGKHCEAVCDCLTSEDAETRVLAASTVGKMTEYVKQYPRALERVLELARDEDGRKRSAAVLALGYMGKDASTYKDVVQDLLNDDFEEEADNALTVGGCRGRMPPACRKARCAAAASLGRIAAEDSGFGWDGPAAEVARQLDSSDWEVRLCALDCLAALGGRARSHAVKVAAQFSDEKYIIRSKAARAYGKLGETASVAGLADLVQDSCPAVKSEAAVALSQLGSQGAEYCDKVYELLRDISADVRAAAITALAGMSEKGPYFASAIAQRLKMPDGRPEDPKVRIAALEALATPALQARAAAFADLINEQLKDELPSVREAAQKSLSMMGMPAMGYGAIEDNGNEE